MLKENARAIAAAVFLADLLVVAAAFLAAHLLRRDWLTGLGLVSRPFYSIHAYLPLLPLALVVWAWFLLSSKSYRSHRTVALLPEIADLLRVTVLSSLTFILLLFFFRLDQLLLNNDNVSRAWIVLFATLAFLGLLAEKIAVRLTAHRLRKRGYNYRALLIVGTGPVARSIVSSITSHRYWGYRLLGYVADDGESEGCEGLPRLGSLDDLARIVDETAVDEVVLTVNYLDHPEIKEGLFHAQALGVNTRFAFDPFPTLSGRLSLGELDGIPLVTWTRVAASQPHLALKRCIDLFVSALSLVILLPILGLLAVAIKATSTGSALFRQQRVGLNGRLFTLLKFRTMTDGAEKTQAEMADLNEMDGPVFKIKDDPRVTPVGRWIRRFSLDELPQLWNVLKGDMSLVGPRPPVPSEVEQYDRWQKRRLSMRPGLTCLWQIGGRNEIDFDRWMELDLAYIDNWSPWLDFEILLKTIPVVIQGKGAY